MASQFGRKLVGKPLKASRIQRGLKVMAARPMYMSARPIMGQGFQRAGGMFASRNFGGSESLWAAAMDVEGASVTLEVRPASASIPHPEKRDKGGEDAWFVSRDGRAFGVFDGVGSWSEMGIDPGIYSTSLARESDAAYEVHGAEDPRLLMEKAWLNSQHITGSSTACCITVVENKLRAANLGDSGFILVREGSIVHQEGEQTHGFNFPYQLGTGSSDSPKDARIVELEVRAGDVVVAATDGVLDNVFPSDICSIVSIGLERSKNESEIAQRIAQVASLKAHQPSGKTPFSEAANKVGYAYEGGKVDISLA